MSKIFRLPTIVAAGLIALTVVADARQLPGVKGVVDTVTKEVFVVSGGKVYGCAKCLPEKTGSPAERTGWTTVLWLKGYDLQALPRKLTNVDTIKSRWVKCASEIVRAYEREIGGDPDGVVMPAEAFISRQEKLMRSAPGRCKDNFLAFSLTH